MTSDQYRAASSDRVMTSDQYQEASSDRVTLDRHLLQNQSLRLQGSMLS